ncbi:hypothetical protein CSV77_16390 [Sporosarcina sp. P16b]|uniref:hypothetical protein n=1 Tax=Sporosarcina sp. P16b TaxID=2048261 RepID=UPI000C1720F9|nr:hypothetical protein [Sporosarcina sp. P16b]PIC68939.1 hypothetical protein CSV77_16390 [Sporosarcina sp. P16b]
MFNFDDFVSHLHNIHGDKLTYQEIEKIVVLDDYEKDSPLSLGKRLVINQMKIMGQKNTGEKINYQKIFDSGVNVLFADNSKGKSSLFKVIKFALTGEKNSIKKDVLSWLHEIFLEFNIGNVSYTVYINLLGKRTSSGLYRVNLKKLLTYREQKKTFEPHLIQFEANTDKYFKESMEDFFFKELSYYGLKWTSSDKRKIDLVENQTTWKTYYKSIYLESKDYNVLFLNQDFGGQEKKIMEMLLGLQLTSAINSLNHYKEHLSNNLKKQNFLSISQDNSFNDSNVESELYKVNEEINFLKQKQKSTFLKSFNLEQYNDQAELIKEAEEDLRNLKSHEKEMEIQINQFIKQINRLEEELSFGMFFSNLEVKACPRCEQKIVPERKSVEKIEHKCMLCENNLSETNQNQKEVLESKLTELVEQQKKLKVGYEVLNQEIILKEKEAALQKSELLEIEESLSLIEFTEEDIDSLSNLIEKKIELEYRLSRLDSQNEDSSTEKLYDKIDVLDSAIKELNVIRIKESDSILSSLKSLILKQIHTFGLVSVTDVVITDNLEIQYLQNGELTRFGELNEGEQLRAKIAFFISLIQLDIVFSVGRHPRLLIIDSPGKEEVISKDLEGLSSLFKEIEKNYGDDLQIIIGTALEPLKNASIAEKVDSRETGVSVF